MTRYAVVKIAGLNKGTIRSVHRTWGAAWRSCPATFFTVMKVKRSLKVGECVA